MEFIWQGMLKTEVASFLNFCFYKNIIIKGEVDHKFF